MRPRVFPAEDGLPKLAPWCSYAASMRPRVFPAEDATVSTPGTIAAYQLQ